MRLMAETNSHAECPSVEPHRWDVTPKEAIALQHRLASSVCARPLVGPVRYLAGVDCAFADHGRVVLAAAVLVDAESMDLLATAVTARPCAFPYVPGLLSFREAPAVLDVLGELPHQPDLLLCDGQGLAHPRGLGLASHVGLLLGWPAIGVAKSRLCGEHRQPGLRRGCRTQLKYDGRVVGAVLRTRHGVRPLFVSVGHCVTLDDAVRWVLRCGRGYRLPEPSRWAHQAVTRAKKQMPHP